MPRILIADDNIVSAMELTEGLAGLDCEVVGVTTSGEEAVEMISELNPDLVLMEMNMPGHMDGVTAAESIKAIRDVPIIFVNGDAREKMRKRARKFSSLDYIPKPFTDAEVAAAIKAALHI